MRLLRRQGDRLVCTPNCETPTVPYAILSHTWGSPEDEVLFEELNVASTKAGYKKIDFCLRQAATDGLDYVWIDSCCIDKRNNTELGEAMNRMYQYYASAQVCYVYMADVEELADFVKSKWHTRGWTLQELLAPRQLQFYSKSGRLLGDRTTLRAEILEACGIDLAQAVEAAPFTERFRWSLQRQTTKPEDASYCMLGLLEVTMVVNYGIGPDSAREELLRMVGREHGEKTVREIRALLSADARRAGTAQDLLSRLWYNEMGLRRAEVGLPLGTTCDWILQHVHFKHWTLKGGYLWIQGKPGAGKSTLIRFAESQCSSDQGIRLSHYFNACNGKDIEKTSEGLYRALLWQLLETNTALLDAVNSHWAAMGTSHLPQWSLPTLQRLLKHTVRQAKKPMVVYIDALDECKAHETQGMVDFLLDLNQDMGIGLSICFTSRYYPSVMIPGSLQLRLEAQGDHDKAIASYVEHRLAVGCAAKSKALRKKVVAKANKIFLWVVLTIEVLNKAVADGHIHQLQQILDQLPSKLSDLMDRIILQQPGSTAIFKASMQWLLFSLEPLSPEQYYYAVLSTGSDYEFADQTGTSQSLQKGHRRCIAPGRVARETLAKFVHSSSKGLAEIAGKPVDNLVYHDDDPYPYHSRVQFIHLSVQDFFLNHGAIQRLFPEATVDIGSQSHDMIRAECQRFLRHARKQSSPHPMRIYAELHLIDHAEQAAAHIPQDEFVSRILQLNAKVDSRPAMLHRDPHHMRLSRLVMECAVRLTRTAYTLGHAFDTPGQCPLLYVASSYNSGTEKRFAMMKLLLEIGVNPDACDAEGRTTLMLICARQTIRKSLDREVHLLIEHGANVNAQCLMGNTALIECCRSVPDVPILRLLLESGAEKSHSNTAGYTAATVLAKAYSAWKMDEMTIPWAPFIDPDAAWIYDWEPLSMTRRSRELRIDDSARSAFRAAYKLLGMRFSECEDEPGSACVAVPRVPRSPWYVGDVLDGMISPRIESFECMDPVKKVSWSCCASCAINLYADRSST